MLSLGIQKGLIDDMVLQRGTDDTATAFVEGFCAPEVVGTVVVTVFLQGFPVLEWEELEVGSAAGGAWSAELKGLPVGGPYTVQFSVGDYLATVRGILVGDLWVLAGQSNMEGCGDLKDVETPSPYVHVLDMARHWRVAVEPLHWLCDSPDSCHCEATGEVKRELMRETHRTRTKGAGLGLSFAKQRVAETGVPVGLVACAHGGTSMQQWNPELKAQGGGSLYGSMLLSVAEAGGKVAGVLWYQGESDANPNDAPLYTKRMENLIENIRADFQSPNLPFYLVQIGRVVMPPDWGASAPTAWNSIQEQERQLVERVPHTGVAASIDLELDDLIHIGTQGLKRLGARLAILAQTQGKGVHLQSVMVEGANRDCLRVSFLGVSEAGFPEQLHITGFSFRRADGSDFPLIYKAMTDPQNPADVLLWLIMPLPEEVSLWYGYGFDPACSLTDAEDQAVPVFGPISIA